MFDLYKTCKKKKAVLLLGVIPLQLYLRVDGKETSFIPQNMEIHVII
jgi:hypothetical protein